MAHLRQLKFCIIVSHKVKSHRLSVSFPVGVFKEIQDLAKQLGTSESKAALFLVIKGLEAAQGTENPLRKK